MWLETIKINMMNLNIDEYYYFAVGSSEQSRSRSINLVAETNKNLAFLQLGCYIV